MASTVKRTTMNLDAALVREVAAILGTRQATETVHEAMRSVIARERRRRLASRDFEDLTAAAIEKMRRPAGRTTG